MLLLFGSVISCVLIAHGCLAQDDLNGPYIGAFGSIGKSQSFDYYRYDDGDTMLDRTLGAFGGYSIQTDNFLYGVELSLGAGIGHTRVEDSRYTFGNSLPAFDGLNGGSTPVNSGYGDVYSSGGPRYFGVDFHREIFVDELFAPMLSGRIGVTFGDFLLYGRAGAGATLMQIDNALTATTTWCGSTIRRNQFTPNMNHYTIVECTDRSTETVKSSDKKLKWSPTVAAAVGAEYNYNRLFTRLEAEARYVRWGDEFLLSQDNGVLKYRVTVGVGVRF